MRAKKSQGSTGKQKEETAEGLYSGRRGGRPRRIAGAWWWLWRYGGGRCVGGVENWRAGRETMECEWNGPGRGRGKMGPGAGSMYQVPRYPRPPPPASKASLRSPTHTLTHPHPHTTCTHTTHTHTQAPPKHRSTPTHAHLLARSLVHSTLTHPVSQSPSPCSAGRRLSGALPKKPRPGMASQAQTFSEPG